MSTKQRTREINYGSPDYRADYIYVDGRAHRTVPETVPLFYDGFDWTALLERTILPFDVTDCAVAVVDGVIVARGRIEDIEQIDDETAIHVSGHGDMVVNCK